MSHRCKDGWHIFDLDNDAVCDICGIPKRDVVDIIEYDKAWEERLRSHVPRASKGRKLFRVS